MATDCHHSKGSTVGRSVNLNSSYGWKKIAAKRFTQTKGIISPLSNSLWSEKKMWCALPGSIGSWYLMILKLNSAILPIQTVRETVLLHLKTYYKPFSCFLIPVFKSSFSKISNWNCSKVMQIKQRFPTAKPLGEPQEHLQLVEMTVHPLPHASHAHGGRPIRPNIADELPPW